eukprot:259422_1
MSSLFKNSFQSKQLKKFTEITLKAIPSIQRDAIKPIYKTIKSGKNQDFDSIDSALHALERKRKIDLQIASYSNIINDKQNNTFSEVQSAKSHVVNLTTNDDTSQLLQQIERAFSLDKGSLSHPQSNNTHLIPSKSKRRSLSVTKSNGLPNIDHITKDSGSDTPAIDEIRANALRALSESPKPTKDTTQQRERKRSRSVMNLNTHARSHPMRVRKSDTSIIPGMNTKEYLQFLLEKAVTNKTWNDNDADRLCKCAISMKCDWITVHSMWVKKCFGLLKQYTINQYKIDLKAHKKSKRRGSRMIAAPPKQFKKVKDENELKSLCKICVTIGYPLGQTSTVSKVAETRQSVEDGAQRVRLMVSAGKVITEDWKYVLQEVKSVVSAADGCDVRIVFPDTNQITEDVKHQFNQMIMQGMAAKTPTEYETNIANKSRDKPKKALRCTFSDDESSDEELSRSTKSVRSTPTGDMRKRKKRTQKKYTKKEEDSDTSDDESSVSFSSFDDCNTPKSNPPMIELSKSETQVNVDQKISKKLIQSSPNNKKKRGKKNNTKNARRASTMTSIKCGATKAKKGGGNKASVKGKNRNKKKRKTLMINQSTTTTMDLDPGAVTDKKQKTKKNMKKKKRKKNAANGKSVGTIEELKKGKKKKKKKKKDSKTTGHGKASHKRKKKENEREKGHQKRKKEKVNKTTNKAKKNMKRKGKKADKRRAKSVANLKTKRAMV